LRAFAASIWRSHLVARQWLRLASRRRLDVAVRLFVAVPLVDYVAGYGALAADPWWRAGQTAPSRHVDYVAPTNEVLRFFTIGTAYLLVGPLLIYWSTLLLLLRPSRHIIVGF